MELTFPCLNYRSESNVIANFRQIGCEIELISSYETFIDIIFAMVRARLFVAATVGRALIHTVPAFHMHTHANLFIVSICYIVFVQFSIFYIFVFISVYHPSLHFPPLSLYIIMYVYELT